MRGRNKPWADQFILDHADYLYHQETSFLNNQETYLEVGIGKGDFIIQSCQYYPHVNHIGVELNKSVFAIALKKIALLYNIKLIDLFQKAGYLDSQDVDSYMESCFKGIEKLDQEDKKQIQSQIDYLIFQHDKEREGRNDL